MIRNGLLMILYSTCLLAVSVTCDRLEYCEKDTCSDAYEAIRWIHRQLDDDADGQIEVQETDEFLREELSQANGKERKQAFHENDHHISVDELWRSWKGSDVHNWTVDEVLEWLAYSVELPQYKKNFFIHEINGTSLPILASAPHFLTGVLKIKDAIHRQKISLKAMDIILFGPGDYKTRGTKDTIMVICMLIASGGCWYAFFQKQSSQKQIKKMMKDLESLQKAELSLMNLQGELSKAKDEKGDLLSVNQQLEEKLKSHLEKSNHDGSSQNSTVSSLPDIHEYGKLQELEEELRQAREQLNRANRAWTPPSQLQLWLQLTHEIENKHYNQKRIAAEQQLMAAKEGCERLRKKRQTFMGSFRVAHGSSIDDVDNRILAAKSALAEVTHDLQERSIRWRQIESLCSFPIINNRGLEYLQSTLLLSLTSPQQQQTQHISSMTRTSSDGALIESEESP